MPPYLQRWFYFPNSFLAVDFFFCLSGFIIAYSYERRILNGMSLVDFSLARLIRLYPLYFLGSMLGLLSAAILTHAYSRNHLAPGDLLTTTALSFLLLPNLGKVWANHNIFPLNGPAWSLFFELFANLLFWFVIRSRFASKLWLLGVAGTCLLMLSLGQGPLADAGAFSQTFTQGFARVGFSFCMGIFGIAGRTTRGRRAPLQLFRRLLLSSLHFASTVFIALGWTYRSSALRGASCGNATQHSGLLFCRCWNYLVCGRFLRRPYPSPPCQPAVSLRS
jgi:peptidoglycan/LPS O-acetylase OafA/YrhL